MNSARTFLRGIIDYAGLFPPAALDMKAAVAAYDSYLRGSDRDLLGRFVIPVGRLTEFDSAVAGLEAREPWSLSLIAAGDPLAAREAANAFNERHASGFSASIDTIEIAASTEDSIACAGELADEFKTFIEIPLSPDPQPLIAAIANTRASAKMRTGGVVASAIPSADEVLTFIELCHDAGVSFKATAGLHHLVRGDYALTYEPGSPRAEMFGYLNIFVATAFAMQYEHDEALQVLTERDPSQFRFDDTGVMWRDNCAINSTLSMVRDYVAMSFGSCSFEEPVSEAKARGIL